MSEKQGEGCTPDSPHPLGVPEKVIQSVLRHANVSTTITYYVKTRDEQNVQAMEKLENALPESLSVN